MRKGTGTWAALSGMKEKPEVKGRRMGPSRVGSTQDPVPNSLDWSKALGSNAGQE